MVCSVGDEASCGSASGGRRPGEWLVKWHSGNWEADYISRQKKVSSPVTLRRIEMAAAKTSDFLDA